MTDISNAASTQPYTRPSDRRRPHRSFRVEEVYWGYRIVPEGVMSFRLVVLQVAAMLSGGSFMAAAITLAVLAETGDIAFRMPAILCVLAAGGALMWFASRGTQVHFEVDTLNGELREAVRNRTGALTVMGRYGFDCIGSVFIVRHDDAMPTLVLRYRNTARKLTVATGLESKLATLRDRLGRDLIVNRESV